MMRGHAPTRIGESFIGVKSLRTIAWEPLYTAADCLLDMLIQLNCEQEKPMKGVSFFAIKLHKSHAYLVMFI